MNRHSPEIKDAAKAIRKFCGVRSGPLTPWERFKIMSYANTMSDGILVKEGDVQRLRTEAEALESLAAKVEAGEITEAEAMEKAKQFAESHLRESPKQSLGMSDNQLNTEIGQKLVQQTKTNLQQQRDFVAEVQDAKMALELAVTTFRKSTVDFLDEMTRYLTDVRQTKIALGTETRGLLAQCQDVRTFFLSPEHTNEVQRLKEFVEICERLKALKDSGFLDNVADTILKLAPAV